MPKHYKIYLFGGHGVGKTSIINLLIRGKIKQYHYATIEDIYEVILESDRGNKERVSLFDTRGLDDKTSSIPNYYLATADAAIFVFSVNSMASFDLVKRLKMEATKIRGNDGEFDQFLRDAGSKLVVVNFYADWNGPSRMFAPKFQELSKKYSDVLFAKVNVDENSDISESCGISAIPAFLYYKHGVKYGEVVGASEAKVEEYIKRFK